MLFYYLGKFCLIAAVLLIAGAVYGYVNIQKSLKNSEVMNGTIVAVNTPKSDGLSRSPDFNQSGFSWIATFSYRFEGKEYRQPYPTYYSDENKPVVGSTVEIYVNKEVPTKFLINKFNKLYSLEATLSFLALVCLFIGLPMHFLLGPELPNVPVQSLVQEKFKQFDRKNDSRYHRKHDE